MNRRKEKKRDCAFAFPTDFAMVMSPQAASDLATKTKRKLSFH